MLTQEKLIEILNLSCHHEEGGYFCETYRSPISIPGQVLPEGYGGSRVTSTAIYYMLTPASYSRLHRLKSDEVYHFYLGDPIELCLLFPDGGFQVVLMGPDLEAGQNVQYVIPKGVWQGSRQRPAKASFGYSLIGCTVSPGFEFADFEAGKKEELCLKYPQAKELISLLTPD